MKVTINATKARQNFFDLLKATKEKKQITEITLGDEVVAEIRPKKPGKFDWDKYKKEMEKARKVLAECDWSNTIKAREESRKDRFPDW